MKLRAALIVLLGVSLAGSMLACSKKAEGPGVEPEGEQAKESIIRMPKEFSADVVTKSPAGDFEAKLYSSDGNTRMDTPHSTVITRVDKGVVWVLMPTKMYIEQPMSPENAGGFSDKLPEGFSRSFVTEEELKGKKVKKYRISFEKDGESGEFYQWIDDDGIPLKVAGEGDAWFFEYRNVKPGEQDPKLFEIPAGYRKMEMSRSR